MRKILFILGLALFSIATVSEAQACMCAESSIREDFERVGAVFQGNIVSGKGGNWNIEVNQVWKGKVEKNVQFIDASQDETSMSTCSVGTMDNDKEYIFFVYPDKKEKTTKFHFSPCNYVVEWNSWSDILRISDKEKYWKKLKAKKPIERKKL